jgi:hypothetical protein
MNLSEKIFLDEALKATAEKYEKLRQQRLNATKKWNSNHRDKVNEYNKFYQRRLNAKKKASGAGDESNCSIKNNNDPEQYKKYQESYRKTSKLRKLPFFNSEIIF